MSVREVDLPGVGKKYTVDTQTKEQVVVVLHRSGKREIYRFRPDESVPSEVIDLTSDEAHLLGGILSQTYFEASADPSRELVMKELMLDWISLPEGHLLTGKTLRELAIRERTGAAVVAILRNGQTVINPDPNETFRAGDTVMVIGNGTQVESFKQTFRLQLPDNP